MTFGYTRKDRVGSGIIPRLCCTITRRHKWRMCMVMSDLFNDADTYQAQCMRCLKMYPYRTVVKNHRATG